MLLFWRKRKRGLQRRNAQEEIPSTHDGKKTLILLVVLHLYIAICAYAFQKLEYVEAKTQRPNLKRIAVNLSRRFNISGNDSLDIIQNILGAAEKDRKVFMSSSWNEFSKAFWFVTILFTTVGKFPCFVFIPSFPWFFNHLFTYTEKRHSYADILLQNGKP